MRVCTKAGKLFKLARIYCSRTTKKTFPVSLKTEACFNIFADEENVCFSQPTKIKCKSNINLNGNSIKHVRTQIYRTDEATKAYFDRIQYKTATDIIGLNRNIEHTLFIFPDGKTITNGKIILLVSGGLNERRGVGCSITTPVNALWSSLHEVFRGSTLIAFVNDSPSYGWTRKSVYIISKCFE